MSNNFRIDLNLPTEEELIEIMKERYESSLRTPENFSMWYSDLSEAIVKSGVNFLSPKSSFIVFEQGAMDWLRSGEYELDEIESFNSMIIDKLASFPWIEGEDKFFIKTGIFSNKFSYSYSCELNDINEIGSQFLDMYYSSMLLGADSTNELVIREYIESEIKDTIYDGMPLRTEFRVFIDIDKDDSRLIDVVNYWQPELMKEHLTGDDLETYISAEDRLVEDFNSNKDTVGDGVLEIARHIDSDVLHGRWSIDVMLEKGEFYVIDCARMDRSALVEYVKDN